ncbi:23S rRNA (uracil(1939)-C(5))-methyltransferase RlmD [Acinetobacter ihumii]|uniref:23S rRNA (uracil(1939)-C(5))-methyltransferase RlmD n=1 Tax=Acinetobacter ihumii TaxID=2483802 RepID=UPI001031AA9F|nr:23S rRNA (uracil(1939)-C(5))-methyltransferase RlmD [Acinetobacter ihumii]
MKHAVKSSAQPAIYTFQVESLSHEGRGIAHFGTDVAHPQAKTGKKVFIRYALPGETVRAKISHETKRLEEGELLELLSEPSALRVDPICPHYGVCGGCSMQHMHPDEQIELKQNVLKSHLQHFAGLEATEWLSPIRSARQDYRHRARIGVRYLAAKKKLMMGFREHQSNHLTSIHTCPILQKQLSDALPELKQLLQSLKGKADIGHIELAMGDQEIALLIRHVQPLADIDQQALLKYVQNKGWQLYLQPKSHTSSLKRIDDLRAEMRLHYSLPDFDLNFAFSPVDFTQVNPSVNQQMVQLACELLQLREGEQVLDLFCGLGNFSLALARRVGVTGRVVAVEGSDEMVQRGMENAKRNNISQVEFYSQDLTKDLSHHSWAKRGFDALLIDPPRAGAFEVMQYIPNFGAKRIVYVSCNPATLARDASVLAEQGYQLKKAGVMDMFTHTGHVESIALFEKIKEIND